MNKIDFSHDYLKLHGQKTARLISVWQTTNKALEANPFLVEYDTKYIPETLADIPHCDFEGDIDHCHYPLPKGDLVVLVFLGDQYIPFCTIRTARGRYGDKYEYYSKHIGEWFDLNVEVVE